MKQHAINIHNATIDYDALISAQNSNSTIAPVLNLVRIAAASNLPLNTNAEDLPGVSNLLGFNTTLYGTPANDVIWGHVGNDILRGGDGDDNFSGSDGNDTIDGGAWDDVLTGGLGNDILLAGFEEDQLSGNENNDIFGFYAPGHFEIQDLNLPEDRIYFGVVQTGLNNIDKVNQIITPVNQREDGVEVEFGPNASIDLIGINFTEITAEMIKFS